MIEAKIKFRDRREMFRLLHLLAINEKTLKMLYYRLGLENNDGEDNVEFLQELIQQIKESAEEINEQTRQKRN